MFVFLFSKLKKIMTKYRKVKEKVCFYLSYAFYTEKARLRVRLIVKVNIRWSEMNSIMLIEDQNHVSIENMKFDKLQKYKQQKVTVLLSEVILKKKEAINEYFLGHSDKKKSKLCRKKWESVMT